jgi:hypothetical protein
MINAKFGALVLMLVLVFLCTGTACTALHERYFWTQSGVFEDDFESYELGTFPSSGGWELRYPGAGSQDQKIIDQFCHSPEKSLQLLGEGIEGGSHMAAVAAYPIDPMGGMLTYEVCVAVDAICSFASSGIVGFGQTTPVGVKWGVDVRFSSDGTIRTLSWGPNIMLQSYEPGVWYKINVELNTVTNAFSVWIDDELRGSGLVSVVLAGDIDLFSLTSGYPNTKAYFDDVKLTGLGVQGPCVYVDPSEVETGIGQNFTSRIVIDGMEGLYGLDIQLRWNSTLLDYVSHRTAIPVETYPDGVLHDPVAEFSDEVDPLAGIIWIAYASLQPAPPFDGGGVVVEITFQAREHGVCALEIINSELADIEGDPISHSFIDGLVTIRDFHDLAVTQVSPAKTAIGQGYCTRVDVTVANIGTFSETFNVTLCANETIIDVVQLTLDCGASETIAFIWNTTGWVKSYYTISAEADVVEDERSTADNLLMTDLVLVSIPGDIDGDKEVDIFDAVKMTSGYGCTIGDAKFKPNADIDNDGQITIYDVVILADHYSQSWT